MPDMPDLSSTHNFSLKWLVLGTYHDDDDDHDDDHHQQEEIEQEMS